MVEEVMQKIKTQNLLRHHQKDMDIALYAKIGYDLQLDFKMEDNSLNSKVKRMIIRG